MMFSTKVIEQDGQRVVEVHGEIDLSTAPQLRHTIQDALRGGWAVAVDLADVGYMDSTGVGVLVQGLKDAMAQKIDFTLRNPSEPVLGVITLARLDTLFKIQTTN